MLLQAVAGEIEELRCGLEIDFRADDVLVAKICRQPWELSVNIHPVFGPGREAMDSESMSELVGPRSSPRMGTIRERRLLVWIIRVLRSRSTSAIRSRTASPSRKPVQ